MASEYSEWIKQIDEISDQGLSDKQQLYDLTQKGFNDYDGNSKPDALWRMGRAEYLLAAVAEKNRNTDKQKKLLFEAEEHLKKALDMSSKDADAHIWMCYTLGKVSAFLGTKERIERGKQLQIHLETAIKLRPNDSNLYHVYGRWCIEVAKLGWMEKKIAAVIFSAPPEATYDDAMKNFIKANELRANWKTNYGYIAQVYIAQGKYKDAIQWIDDALKLPSQNDEDDIVHADLVNLQKKYASYR